MYFCFAHNVKRCECNSYNHLQFKNIDMNLKLFKDFPLLLLSYDTGFPLHGKPVSNNQIILVCLQL